MSEQVPTKKWDFWLSIAVVLYAANILFWGWLVCSGRVTS